MGTRFVWDPVEDNIVKELDDAGNTVVDYTTEPFLFGDVISQNRNGQSHFNHYDTQGNTTELTDISGNTTDTRRYSAFGTVTESTGTTDFPFQFGGEHGYYGDRLTGHLFVRRRLYQALTSRWSSPDPPGVRFNELNAYTYVGNAPTDSIDPTGLEICPNYRIPDYGGAGPGTTPPGGGGGDVVLILIVLAGKSTEEWFKDRPPGLDPRGGRKQCTLVCPVVGNPPPHCPASYTAIADDCKEAFHIILVKAGRDGCHKPGQGWEVKHCKPYWS